MTGPALLDLFDSSRRRSLRGRLLRWFARHARNLPWRRTRDPYAVWLSEIMLQQTQVATVEGYFERFLARFPDIRTLAEADEQEVLRLWEGLGYYRRARQLHRAAQIVVAEHGGQFPQTMEAVRNLPGIGRYTAGAVLSIAFDVRAPILEANTQRLFCRLLGYQGRPDSTEGQRLLWQFAEMLLPRKDVGQLNQALMELGSEICTPRAPACPECPAATLCEAQRRGLQASIPVPKSRSAATELREAAVLLKHKDRVLLVRCPEGGRWAGLWDFPRVGLTSETPDRQAAELTDKVYHLTGSRIEIDRHLHTLRHGVTRYRITLDCYAAHCRTPGRPPAGTEVQWLRPAELADYPLNATGRKLAQLLS